MFEVIETPKAPVVRHPGFAKRLAQCLDTNPNVPDFGAGRQKWLVDEFEKKGITISPETIRKYIRGWIKPTPNKMRILSDILGVQRGWLEAGEDNGLTKRDLIVRGRQLSASTHILAAHALLAGHNVSFPDEDDRRAQRDHIDLYIIARGGRHYSCHATTGRQQPNGTVIFDVPVEFDNAQQIGVVAADEGFSVRFVRLSYETIEKFRARAGHIEVVLTEEEIAEYEIKSLDERL